MKQVRRFATRGVLVPVALMALIAASSIPASAATLSTSSAPAQTVVAVKFGPLSISW